MPRLKEAVVENLWLMFVSEWELFNTCVGDNWLYALDIVSILGERKEVS